VLESNTQQNSTARLHVHIQAYRTLVVLHPALCVLDIPVSLIQYRFMAFDVSARQSREQPSGMRGKVEIFW
jgi:hypothetical protein